jgi:hypothetical protein
MGQGHHVVLAETRQAKPVPIQPNADCVSQVDAGEGGYLSGAPETPEDRPQHAPQAADDGVRGDDVGAHLAGNQRHH